MPRWVWMAAIVGAALAAAAPASAVTVVPDSYVTQAPANGYHTWYPDGTGRELIDGTIPGADYNESGWTAWYISTVTVTFDFGESDVFDRVRVFYWWGGAGIEIPTSVRIAFSADGSAFTNERTFTNPADPPLNPDWIAFDLTGDAATRTGRYVRLVQVNASYWTFNGEVQFEGPGSPVPEPTAPAVLAAGALAVLARRRRWPAAARA